MCVYIYTFIYLCIAYISSHSKGPGQDQLRSPFVPYVRNTAERSIHNFDSGPNDWPWLALNEWVDGKRICKRNQKKWLNHRMTNSASALSPVSSQLLIIWAASERCLLWNASSLSWLVSDLFLLWLYTSLLSYFLTELSVSLSNLFSQLHIVRAIYFVCQLLLLWATSSVDHFFSELPSLWPILFSQPLQLFSDLKLHSRIVWESQHLTN